eukprot:753925-Hanusia_phi.AAC.7
MVSDLLQFERTESDDGEKKERERGGRDRREREREGRRGKEVLHVVNAGGSDSEQRTLPLHLPGSVALPLYPSDVIQWFKEMIEKKTGKVMLVGEVAESGRGARRGGEDEGEEAIASSHPDFRWTRAHRSRH